MANEGRILVDPQALETQANAVYNAAEALRMAFEEMNKRIRETESYWKGDAAEAHRKNYTKNQSNIEEILARYNEHVRDLEQMAGIYREAETKATNLADELPLSNL